MKKGISTDAKYQLDDGSLIKWDNKNNKEILSKARKLIWIAYISERQPEAVYETLSHEFDVAWRNIETAEENLYAIINRHQESEDVNTAEQTLQTAIERFQSRMPSVFDPFAGGGAIPLEAARLGCRSYGNDINPVAHIIEKGSVEFPQKYGKQIRYTREEFLKIYGNDGFQLLVERDIPQGEVIEIPNRLSFDVEYWAKKLLKMTEKEVGHLYPVDKNGNKPIAYYWARTATCSNPSCRAEVPLLRQFYLANTKTKQVYLNPIINGNTIDFEIKTGKCEVEGWNKRGNLTCPCCKNVTDVNIIKDYSISNELGQQILAVIDESPQGKLYRLPNESEITILQEVPTNSNIPSENMQRNSAGGDTFSWGITKWGQLFSNRQLAVITSIVEALEKIKNALDIKNDFNKAVVTYLTILLNRITPRSNMFGLWNTIAETLEHIFGRQAIPMVFDYPESNIFSNSGGGGISQIQWITRYIENESNNPFSAICKHATSGDKTQFKDKELTAVITDPPYYDAIAYADLSDFFYIWFKKTLQDIYPLNFATPQTPKTEECTALKHHHENNVLKANLHFEDKLSEIFSAIEKQTSDIVSIMYAHQSTQAWTTLCNSILTARMNITGSWAIDSERSNAGIKTDKAFLESSVTVSCRPSQRTDIGNYRKVKQAIETKVAEEVESLYQLGFRGADLLTACFGQAVSEFGKYETVEKADGSEVTVGELLEMARMAAFNALLKGFDGDEYTRFYIGWLQMNGMVETDFDDAAKFARIGVSMNIDELFKHKLLIKEGNKQHLASYRERTTSEHQGFGEESLLIDSVQQAMLLWHKEDRTKLLQLIKIAGSDISGSFWRVLASLKELLPAESDDSKQVNGLLSNRDDLIRDAKRETKHEGVQGNLNFD